MDISDVTATDLQNDIIGPFIIKEYREQVAKRMKDDKYMDIFGFYLMCIFQDFESFRKTDVDLVRDDIKLVLDEYNTSFVTYELQPSIYAFKDLSEALFNTLQPDYPGAGTVIDTEFDDLTRKSKLVVRSGIIARRFDENSFFSTILEFTSGWDYEHYNEYISQKIVNLSSTNKVHLKRDVIDGIIVGGLRQPILSIFVLDEPSGYKLVCEPETIHYKKTESVCSEYY